MPNHNLSLVNNDNDKSSNDTIDSNQDKYYHQVNNNNNNSNGSLGNFGHSKTNDCSSNGTKETNNMLSIDEYLNVIDSNDNRKNGLISSNGSLHNYASNNNSYSKSNSATGLSLLNKPLKVLICTESFHPYTSGIARRFKEIIERLSKRGFLIHIVTGCKGSETWTNDEDLKDKVTFSILAAIEFKDKIDCALPFLIPQYGMLKAILDFEPDVIHCVEQTPATTFCGALGKTLNIPIVWSSHTNLDYYIPLYIHPLMAPLSLRVYQLLRRTFCNLADYNLTVSRDFVKLLNDNGIKKSVDVWKTGVDSESFNPSYRSHEMRLKMFNGHYSPEKILLVCVGRLSPEKNFEFLLKLLEKFPQTFLCVVGGGPYKESLEPLFPPNQTHFMGFLQGEQLASAYASADYFVYASVSETFGQVYLEAMSSGTPIVAAEGQQMKEFFINGIHGYTWQPGDVNSAVKALNNAIKDRNILSQNCRSNALNHSWNSAANQIAEVYIKLKNDKINKNKSKSLIQVSNSSSMPKKILNFLIKSIRGVYYFLIWLYITILVLTLMAPFMSVTKPNTPSTTQIPILSKSNNKKRHRKRHKKRNSFELIDKSELCDNNLNNNDEKLETGSTKSDSSSFSKLSFSSSSDDSLLTTSKKSKRGRKRDKEREKKIKKRDEILVYNTNGNVIKINRNEKLVTNFNDLSTSSSKSNSTENLYSSSYLSSSSNSLDNNNQSLSSSSSSFSSLIKSNRKNNNNNKKNNNLKLSNLFKMILSMCSSIYMNSSTNCLSFLTFNPNNKNSNRKIKRIPLKINKASSTSSSSFTNIDNLCKTIQKQTIIITSFGALLISLAATYMILF